MVFVRFMILRTYNSFNLFFGVHACSRFGFVAYVETRIVLQNNAIDQDVDKRSWGLIFQNSIIIVYWRLSIAQCLVSILLSPASCVPCQIASRKRVTDWWLFLAYSIFMICELICVLFASKALFDFFFETRDHYFPNTTNIQMLTHVYTCTLTTLK